VIVRALITSRWRSLRRTPGIEFHGLVDTARSLVVQKPSLVEPRCYTRSEIHVRLKFPGRESCPRDRGPRNRKHAETQRRQLGTDHDFTLSGSLHSLGIFKLLIRKTLVSRLASYVANMHSMRRRFDSMGP